MIVVGDSGGGRACDRGGSAHVLISDMPILTNLNSHVLFGFLGDPPLNKYIFFLFFFLFRYS